MKYMLICILFALQLFATPYVQAAPNIPEPNTKQFYMQDFANVVDANTRVQINTMGKELREKTKAQVVAVTVKSLDGENIAEYANAMFRKLKVGEKDLNNGILILVAVDDRKARIEVGYGLEGALPDAKTGRIIREKVP